MPNTGLVVIRQIKGFYIAYIAVGISTYIIALLLYWSLWPISVFRYVGDIKIVTPHPVIGQYLEYEMSYCKQSAYKEVESYVQTTYIDHLLYLTPPTIGPLPFGCNTIDIAVPIPKFHPGFYKLQVERTYELNPLRKLTSKSTSDSFYIFDN